MRKQTQALSLELLLNDVTLLRKGLQDLKLQEGPQGDQGDTGEAGPKGDQGDTGEAGPKGDQGDTGERGLKGDQGDTGERGSKGDQGEAGERGFTGERGLKGDAGERGFTGESGPKGDRGQKAREVEKFLIKDGKLFVKFEGAPPKEVGKLPVVNGAGGGRGPKGDKGDSGGTQTNTSIAVAATELCDEVDVSLVDSVKWTITAVDTTTNEKSVASIMAFSSGSSPVHNVYSRMIKDVPVSFDVQLNSGKLELLITNNHPSVITVKVLRIETQA